MGKPLPHTPTLLVKAGDVNGFSADCVALLIKAGYNPQDFGDFNHTRNKINRARRKCVKAKNEKGANYSPVNDPDGATARLARSDPGHMSQNALYQGERNNACENHPGSEGYDSDLAPCMPHPAHWTPNSGRQGVTQVGTSHHAIGQNEKDSVKDLPVGTDLTSDQVDDISKRTAKIAVDGPGKDGPKPKDEGLLGQAGKNKKQEDAHRDAAAEALKTTNVETPSAKKAAGTAGQAGAAPGDAAGKAVTGDTAEDCIEAWRKAEMAKMRKKVVDKYGGSDADHAKKQAAADKAVESSKKAEDKAKAEAAAAPDGPEKKELERKAKRATEWREKAETKRKSIDCLRDQALQLKKDYPDGNYPTGFAAKVPRRSGGG